MLGVSVRTYQGWEAGRPSAHEEMARKLMRLQKAEARAK